MKLNPARIDPLMKLLAQAWYRQPQDGLGKLLCSLDPRFMADPIGYTDQRLEQALQEFIASKERKDREYQEMLASK